MTREFITYEQALALKELGFDEPCLAFYNHQGKLIMMSQENEEEISIWKNSYVLLGKQYSAPLCQQAFRWFREKHNLVFNFISYNIVKPGEYHWSITWNDEAKAGGIVKTYEEAGGIVKTYEEAEQACLDKLIEICRNDNTSK